MMDEVAFAIHEITNEQRKMLQIRIALTQELRSLTEKKICLFKLKKMILQCQHT